MPSEQRYYGVAKVAGVVVAMWAGNAWAVLHRRRSDEWFTSAPVRDSGWANVAGTGYTSGIP